MEYTDRPNVEAHANRVTAHGTADRVRFVAQAVFVVFCIETAFSVGYRSVFLARQSVFQAWIAGLCASGLVGICFLFRGPVLSFAGRVLQFPSIGNRVWLSFWLIFGLILRLAWILRFPVWLQSDHLAYFQMAADMAKGEFGGGAYWPPGFSLFLTPLFAVFGAHLWVAHVCALAFFVATYFLTYALAVRFGGGLVCRIAPMLIAIWPGHLTLAGINCKESYLAVLIPAALLMYWKASDPRSASPQADHNAAPGEIGHQFQWSLGIAAGLCMGLATLTQPGYLLFPSVILGFEILRGGSILRAIGRTAIFSVALLAAVFPWTCRNYAVFHRIVLVSTNGGSVFYRANNPLADANYSAEGEFALPKDEFAADRLGYKMADDWIAHHPAAFAVLMVRKQVVFLGDDALGAYETMRRGYARPSALYAPIKGVSNLFWLGVWTILFLGFPILFASRNWRLWFGLLFLPLLYQWVIDSVFESGPRHHVPYVAPIAVLAGMVLSAAVQRESNPIGNP